MQIDSHGQTDKGAVRSHNEDAYLDDPNKRIWAVADGMGGHEAGDVASQTVVRHLAQVTRPEADTAGLVDMIDDALENANAELIDFAKNKGLKIVGSTAAILADAGDYMLCGWAGDSRIYQLCNGELRQVTRDHNKGAEMMATGRYSAAQLAGDVNADALVRAVGGEKKLVVQWVAAQGLPGDVFMLCSDGVPKELPEAELRQVLSGDRSPEEMTGSILETCLNRGARDNITAVVVRIGN